MKPSLRRAERLLRSSRRGPWGKGRNALTNAMQPVYELNGDGKPYIKHYRLVTDPWYVNRTGFYKPESFEVCCCAPDCGHSVLGPKSRQRWLKEHVKLGQWDVDHALSHCCGWGNDEGHGGEPSVYPFIGGMVPPRRRTLNRVIIKQRRRSRNRW